MSKWIESRELATLVRVRDEIRCSVFGESSAFLARRDDEGLAGLSRGGETPPGTSRAVESVGATGVSPVSARALRKNASVSDRKSLLEALDKDPDLLLPLSVAASPPIDLYTYRVRRQRYQDGEGPVLRGMDDFMRVAEDANTPSRLVCVQGAGITFMLLLNEGATAILAVLAIEPRPEGAAELEQ